MFRPKIPGYINEKNLVKLMHEMLGMVNLCFMHLTTQLLHIRKQNCYSSKIRCVVTKLDRSTNTVPVRLENDVFFCYLMEREFSEKLTPIISIKLIMCCGICLCGFKLVVRFLII